MASLWTEQSDALLTQCVETFGQPTIWQRGLSLPFTISAILGHPNQEDTEVNGQGITLDVRAADFAGSEENPAPPEFAVDPVPRGGDVVTLGSDSYTAYQVQVDSEGAGKVYLRKL